ncbi:MAG: bifunctional UDP-sugar hydrolase/5'-nucleotidase [Syntrophomonas sp.]
MNRFIKVFRLLLILMLLTSGTSYGGGVDTAAPLTILFTHDLHDNLLPYSLEKDGLVESYGGYARLQTVIKQQREKDPEVVLVDGGDFCMGTLFQTIFSQEAPGLRLMGQMGYDVITLGNHEFDFGPAGLAESLTAAQTSKDPLPLMVAGNIAFPVDSAGKINEPLTKMKDAMGAYGVGEYTILERKGYRIGIFGIMGKEAASCAPMAGVAFTDPIEQARNIVEKLQKQEKVDLIICLSHSGTVSEPDKSEDVILAQKVPGINVIISGHSHSKLDQPITVGDTIICSAGEYGENLGMVTLKKSSATAWKEANYRLIPIDASIPGDAAISQRIEKFKTMVQQSYLDSMNMKFDGKLAYSPFSFAPISQIWSQHAEQPLADLISDAYIYAVKQAEGADYQPVDAAIVLNGTIRASFIKGDITVSDVFNISSLGIGPDKKSGYPLIAVYLTGKELKSACEVDASITPIINSAQLYMSGITYTFNPNRLIFNRVTDVALQRPDGSREEIDDSKLYRVVVGLYSAQMLSVVGEKSFGLLSIVPKTKEGVVITNFEDQIIRDTSAGSKNEVKEWVAIAKYLQSFDQIDGVRQIPSYYNQKQGRKIVNEQTSIASILAKPNTIAWAAYGLITFVLLLIILAIRVFIRRRRRIPEAAQIVESKLP